MTEIVWQDPPARNRGARGGVTAAFVAALREYPGRWALYNPHSGMAKGSSPTEYKRRYPGTEWVTRNREDGLVDFYARWIGEP